MVQTLEERIAQLKFKAEFVPMIGYGLTLKQEGEKDTAREVLEIINELQAEKQGLKYELIEAKDEIKDLKEKMKRKKITRDIQF